jgi:two-component system sensor histidine kinase BaeS
MRLGITPRLFLAVLATSALVVVAMGVSTRIAFTRGFIGYLNEQGIQRIESLVPSLAAAHAEHGSWDFLRGKPGVWFRLIRPRPADADPDAPLTVFPESDLTGVHLRLALLDDRRRWVIGNPEAGTSATMRPVVVNRSVVGWLALLPFQQVTSGAELRFQEQQLTAIWLIGALAVVVAAMVSIGLAHTFLAPVKRIAQATHRLAAGNYGDRLQMSGRDEIGRLAEDFNHLARTLERNEQMRRSFMADISHELRTPLAILRAEIEAIEDGVRPLSREAIGSLRSSTETLGKLVDDLYQLSLSDADALSYRKSDIDLGAVLRATALGFAERLAERRILTDVEVSDEPLMVHADEGRLQQLFGNLLENSLRYTDDGGRLRITCRERSGWAHVDLQDSAPGVPEEALPRLFERFYRVERSRSRAGGGAGLGLAICRNIVEAHGGSISARAAPLGGLWLSITLPVADT